MIVVVLVIVAALAGLAGYFVGRRGRPAVNVVVPPAPVAPAAAAVERAGAEPRGDEGFGFEKARLIRSRDSEAAMLRARLGAGDAASERSGEFMREREQLFRE